MGNAPTPAIEVMLTTLPPPFPQELRQHGLHAEERAAEIEIELFVPDLFGRLRYRDRAEYARIVDQYIGGAEMADDLGDHPFDLRDLCAIGLERTSPRPRLRDPPPRSGGGIVAMIDDGDPRALGRVANRDGLADPLDPPVTIATLSLSFIARLLREDP